MDLTADLTGFLQRVNSQRSALGAPTRTPVVVTSETAVLGGSGGLGGPPGIPASAAPSLQSANATGSHYSFQIVDASSAFNGSPTVLVYDGLINNELPSGMGGDDFFLPASDGMNVYAGVTYDIDSLNVTSRFIGLGDTPDSEFGTLYITLGGAAVSTDSNGNTTVAPYNAQCGDIFFTFDFGGLNGKPALKLTPFSDWIAIPEDSGS